MRTVFASVAAMVASCGGAPVAPQEPPVPPDGHAIAVEVPERIAVRPGSGSELPIVLHVATGFHVMADRPSKPQYIATRVSFDRTELDGVAFGVPVYPTPVSFALDRESIATFVGDVRVRVPFDVRPEAAPGARGVRGTVHYQACTATRCLFPRTESFETTVDVAAR